MGLATRLLVLWLLAERPLHGYRIRKILSAPAFAFWFRIEDASVYAMLRSLVKEGLAELVGEEQEGRRPNRSVYKITIAGRQALRARLEEAWRQVDASGSAVSAALAAVDEFEVAEVAALLSARHQALVARQANLETLGLGAPSGPLARREAALLAAEVAWIEGELRKTDSKGG